MPRQGFAETFASDGQDFEAGRAGIDLRHAARSEVQNLEKLFRRQVPQSEGGPVVGCQQQVSGHPQFRDAPESFPVDWFEEELVIGGRVVHEEGTRSRVSRRAVEDQPVYAGKAKI